MNDYIMFRLLVDDSGRHKQKRNSLQPPVATGAVGATGVGQGAGGPRGSFLIPRKSITAENGTNHSALQWFPMFRSVNDWPEEAQVRPVHDFMPHYSLRAPVPDGVRNKRKVRNEIDKKIKLTSFCRIFGKKKDSGASGKVYNNGEYSQSCDLINGRSRKSPSTTNDSGRGSQGHLEEKMEAMVIEEHLENGCGCEEEEEEEIDAPILSSKRSDHRRHRTSSCPDIASLGLNHPTSSSVTSGVKKCPIVIDTESEEDNFERVKRPCSPISAADCLVERRLNRKFIEQRRQQVAMSHIDEVCDSVSRISTNSRRTAQTEDLADFDDNISSVILDHFLSTTG
ncbi:LOW QUALITY PROTEIN: Protein CBG03274, partial [Caenorhabditis briggsae]